MACWSINTFQMRMKLFPQTFHTSCSQTLIRSYHPPSQRPSFSLLSLLPTTHSNSQPIPTNYSSQIASNPIETIDLKEWQNLLVLRITGIPSDIVCRQLTGFLGGFQKCLIFRIIIVDTFNLYGRPIDKVPRTVCTVSQGMFKKSNDMGLKDATRKQKQRFFLDVGIMKNKNESIRGSHSTFKHRTIQIYQDFVMIYCNDLLHDVNRFVLLLNK